MTYRARDSINKFVSVAKTKSPLYDFASDGVQHTLWLIDARACDRLIEEFRTVPYLLQRQFNDKPIPALRAFPKKHD